jgi:uncharacterized membrane protein (UPF0127 family)
MKRFFWFVLFVVLFGVVAGAELLHFGSYDTSILDAPPSKHVHIAGVPLTVYVADTPAEQERGLGGRDALPEDQGMLFVFPKDDTYAFWMKDMKFPIDIIWLDAEGRVVSIAPTVAPSTYPNTFKPDVPARYVLEVSAGFTDAHGIVVGNVLYNN